MPDVSLHGNGYACPACELRCESEDKGDMLRPDVPCNVCSGTGRLGYTAHEICARTVEEDRRIHWPGFARRIAG